MKVNEVHVANRARHVASISYDQVFPCSPGCDMIILESTPLTGQHMYMTVGTSHIFYHYRGILGMYVIVWATYE